MNLLEQFAKQPLVVKVVLLLLILAVVAGIEWQMFYTARQNELATLQKQSANLQVQLAENQAIADNLGTFREEVNILNVQLKEAFKLLPNDDDIPGLFRHLSIVARKTGIDLLKFRPAGRSNQGFYTDIRMELQIDGSYNDIAIFIDQVGKLSRIVNISNLVFSKARQEGPKTLLTVDCNATTFKFSGGAS